MIVGVISDTHGLLRPQALTALEGSHLIIHAGDVGSPDILARLRMVAPTIAVRGNVDTSPWGRTLAEVEVIEAAGRSIYMLHDIGTLDLDPKAGGFAAVVYGHSHRPGAQERDGVLYLNPGSAGPRRFTLPISLARLTIADGVLSHEFVTIDA